MFGSIWCNCDWCDLLFDGQQADVWFNYDAATMSSPSPSPSLDHGVPCTAHSVSINSKLVVVESVAANKKNKKAATKKTFKNKQFVHKFSYSVENYVGFLNGFLKAHHKDKFEATANHTFTLKIQVPPAKYEHCIA